MPISWRLIGNRDLAAHYRGEANRLLFHLKAVLQDTPSGGLNRTYPDGTIIYIRKFFDNEIVLISSPFRGGKRIEEKLDMFVFLFFTESKYKVYKLAVETNNYRLEEEPHPDTTKFPFDHVWYSDTSEIERNVASWVSSNQANQKHYINTALDPTIFDSKNAFDDWHYHNLQFSMGNYLPDSLYRESPSINDPMGRIHVSISPYTSYPSFYFRMGGINQIFRQYSPEKFLVPILQDDDTILETEILNNGATGAYGKRGMTLSASRGYATSWKEKPYVFGYGSPGITCNVAGPWLGWFYFPWIPYLHEIPGFPILLRGGSVPLYEMLPIPVSPRIYSLQYLDANGVQTKALLSDALAYNYNQGTYAQTGTSFYPILHIEYTGPFGNPFAVGSWADHQAPGGGGGPFSYEINTSGSQNDTGSASGTVHNIIGSTGKLGVLRLLNTFTLSQGRSRSLNSSFTKTTSMPWQYYLWWGGSEEYWMPNGDYTDQTSGDHEDTINETRNLSLTQQMLCGSQVIESLASSMGYSYNSLDTRSGAFTWTFHNQSNLPWTIDGYYVTPHSQESGSLDILATATRNINCVEILDFDSLSDQDSGDVFVVFYKKITISHSQTNTSAQLISGDIWGPSRETMLFPWYPYGDHTESFTVLGNRKVEYWLAFKIGDGTLTKVKLTEFNSSVSKTLSGPLVHTGSGERLWGVSCQLNKDVIVYHYQKDIYKNTGTASSYDSPMNFEDISYQGNMKLWQPSKIVVGCIAVKDTMESTPGYRKEFEFDPASTELIYSVGLHRKDKEQTEQEET